MTRTTTTYTQPAGQYFMDCPITPATVADGSLVQRFNPLAFPQLGTHVTIDTTVALTVSPSGSQPEAQTLTLTATVTPSEGGNTIIDGTATFKNGATVIGTASVWAGVGVLTVSHLPVGTDNLTVEYSGNGEYGASTSATVPEVITLDPTTITLVVTPADPQPAATTLTLTATVSPAAATGTVTFLDGVTTIDTGTLVDGVATITTTLAVGAHSLTAEYGGDSLYDVSTSTAVDRTAS